MTQVIIERDGIFTLGDDSSFTKHKVLPAGVYKIGVAKTGPFLYSAKEFMVYGKLYGNVEDRVKRIMSTFEDRPATTGVLLSGDKGSGKTMLAKRIAQTAVENGLPVIVMSPEIANSGTFIVEYLSSFDFPMVVILDEFEKMFEENEHQNSLLTMFDGLYSAKRLFLLTVNNLSRVNDFFKSRPGRIFYHYRYSGLDTQVVKEYCEDNNVQTDFLSELMVYHQLNDDLTFDSLKAIVEEWKRYNLSFEETIDSMNISMYRTSDKYAQWTVKLILPKLDEVITVYDKYKGSLGKFTVNPDFEHFKCKKGNKTKLNKFIEENPHISYFYFNKSNFIEKNEDGLTFYINEIDPSEAYILISEYRYNYENDTDTLSNI